MTKNGSDICKSSFECAGNRISSKGDMPRVRIGSPAKSVYQVANSALMNRPPCQQRLRGSLLRRL